MFWINDIAGPESVPVCITCICSTCENECEYCPGTTDSGACCRITCVEEEDQHLFD